MKFILSIFSALDGVQRKTVNILIFGNSGQSKFYLQNLILTNFRESGKSMICLDPEIEYVDLTHNLGGIL